MTTTEMPTSPNHPPHQGDNNTCIITNTSTILLTLSHLLGVVVVGAVGVEAVGGARVTNGGAVVVVAADWHRLHHHPPLPWGVVVVVLLVVVAVLAGVVVEEGSPRITVLLVVGARQEEVRLNLGVPFPPAGEWKGAMGKALQSLPR